MKTRKCFVSNSSSSSFIIIGNEVEVPKFSGSILIVPDDFEGNTEFGWEDRLYCSFGSRLNFAYLQTKYGQEGKARLEMLESVLKSTLNVEEIEWNITTDSSSSNKGEVWGYIDHQSSASEGENVEMFDDEDSLYRFLFCKDSYIQGDNDNK